MPRRMDDARSVVENMIGVDTSAVATEYDLWPHVHRSTGRPVLLLDGSTGAHMQSGRMFASTGVTDSGVDVLIHRRDLDRLLPQVIVIVRSGLCTYHLAQLNDEGILCVLQHGAEGLHLAARDDDGDAVRFGRVSLPPPAVREDGAEAPGTALHRGTGSTGSVFHPPLEGESLSPALKAAYHKEDVPPSPGACGVTRPSNNQAVVLSDAPL